MINLYNAETSSCSFIQLGYFFAAAQFKLPQFVMPKSVIMDIIMIGSYYNALHWVKKNASLSPLAYMQWGCRALKARH